jgi:hypothetical protein
MPDAINPNVRRGAALLDEHIPGWFEVIDVDNLDLNSSYNCVLGQLGRHPEVLPEHILQRVRRGSYSYPGFVRVLGALEKITHREIDMHQYAFIEECGYDPRRKFVGLMNRPSWQEAIAQRKALAFQRSRALDDTPLARQVKAAIDWEVEKIRRERELAVPAITDRVYELVA